MNYVIGEHFERFIQDLVQTGRDNDAGEVVREGLRLVEVRENKRKALKEHLEMAIARGGSYSDREIEETLTTDQDPINS